MDIVTEKGHSINVYFTYTLLNLPKIFSKLLIFSYFLTLFVILNRYEESNEILVFWTNGIRKISFINFIGIFSITFLALQLTLNLYIVPITQNLAQNYLKNSSLDFFPKLVEEKKFLNLMQNLTIFVEEHDDNGNLKGIYIKENLKNNEKKIIIANEGVLISNINDFSFKLFDGKITNIINNGSFNLSFKETTYDLTTLNSKTRQVTKLNETNTPFLLLCLERFIDKRKDKNLRCGGENSFLIKEIYEEIFKRAINPVYIIILSLVSSLVILKPKVKNFENYYKSLLFFVGFIIILFSELSYKFIFSSTYIEIFFLILPIILILLFYFYILLITKFKLTNL